MSASDDGSGEPTSASRVARGLARLALDRPKRVLLVGLAVAGCGFWLTSRLSIETDLGELLPPGAESVKELKLLNKRVGGTGNVAIALEGEPAALRAFIPQLVDGLRTSLGPDLLAIKYQKKDVIDYYHRYAAYYVPLADLRRWRESLAERIARAANPGLVDLDDAPPPPAPPPTGTPAPVAADPLKQIIREVRAARAETIPKNQSDPETGYLMSEGGRLAVVFVRPAANSLNLAGSEGMLKRIEDIAAATHPEARGVRISGYTGSIPTALQQIKAIEYDIVSTAVMVVLAVGMVVILYFRSLGGMFRLRLDGWREIFFLLGALVVGAAVAMGFADLWIGHVNAQTAFLGAIIVGTGINYGIIFLDRYRQLRAAAPEAQTRQPQSQADFRAVIERALDDTLRATWIAAAATAVSFGVLAAGEVESFHQFGLMGGVGIFACWVATFTLVPSMVVLADRGRPPRTLPRLRPLSTLFRAVGEGCRRAPWAVMIVIAALLAGSAYLAWGARHDVVESDLRRLSSRSSAEATGMQKLDNRLRPMDDRGSTPAIIATESRAEAAEVCDALRARARGELKDVMGRCYSINDYLPSSLDERRDLMARLKADLAKVPEAELDAGDRAELADLDRALGERPPTDVDLPATVKEPWVERDGSIGKLAAVDPRNDEIEANLYRFSDALREIHLASGKVIHSSGENVVFADVLRAMRHDAQKLTLASALLVLLVLLVVTRRAGTFLRVGGALVAGVLLMVGVAVFLGEKLNFFNFVALPTTFGVGIDYAINVEERLRRRVVIGGGREIARGLGEVGPAVLLASLTSILGYGSLMTADATVLRSFGRLALLGELTCVFVAVVMVPSLWALAMRRRPAAGEVAASGGSGG